MSTVTINLLAIAVTTVFVVAFTLYGFVPDEPVRAVVIVIAAMAIFDGTKFLARSLLQRSRK